MNSYFASLLLALAFVGTAPAAQAQVKFSFGPRVSYGLSTVHFTNDTFFNTRYRSGLEAGVTACLRAGHFALQPTVVYAQKGYQLTFDIPGDRVFEALHYRDNTRLNYVSVPLNVVYSQKADGQGWHVFAGPYVSMFLGGRYTSRVAFDDGITGTPGAVNESSGKVASEQGYDPTDYVTAHTKGVDAGLQGGLGYQYQRVLLQATYSAGIRNVQYKNFAANVGLYYAPYYNRAFQLSLAYLFGPKS